MQWISRGACAGLSGLLWVWSGAALGDLATPVDLRFCTHVGPVDLTLTGQQVSGSYQIIRPQNSTIGTIVGSISANLIDARWRDDDGEGRILIGLSADRQQFNAIYHGAGEPDHWYGWRAWVRPDHLAPAQSCSEDNGE